MCERECESESESDRERKEGADLMGSTLSTLQVPNPSSGSLPPPGSGIASGCRSWAGSATAAAPATPRVAPCWGPKLRRFEAVPRTEEHDCEDSRLSEPRYETSKGLLFQIRLQGDEPTCTDT